MENAFIDNWTIQVRKGVLELCILNALASERLYGYDIVKRLKTVDGLAITEGTIYPLLSRLKRDNLVTTALEESPEGPARKYYALTERGRQQLSLMNECWATLTRSIELLTQEEK